MDMVLCQKSDVIDPAAASPAGYLVIMLKKSNSAGFTLLELRLSVALITRFWPDYHCRYIGPCLSKNDLDIAAVTYALNRCAAPKL